MRIVAFRFVGVSRLRVRNQTLYRRMQTQTVTPVGSRFSKHGLKASNISNGADSVGQTATLRRYAEILMRENRGKSGMLTGAASVQEVLEEHVVDALALIDTLDALVTSGVGVRESANSSIRILDIGSGAGFPGIPLAIVRPKYRFTLLDTLKKRTNFLTGVKDELDLANVDVVWGRAEDLGRDGVYRERYDVVTARAVAELRTLAEFCLPFVKVGGYWMAPKNATVNDEVAGAVNAVMVLGGGVMHIKDVNTIGPDGRNRTVVISRKDSPTDEKYPRRSGKAKKSPL